MAVRVGLTGDVMLGRLVDDRQASGPPSALWGDMLGRLQALEGLLINLECCLSTRGRPWQRTDRPFHFRADPDWAVPALATAGVDVAALANNHVLDFEEPALQDTIDELTAADLTPVGAGRDVEAALDPAVVRIGEVTMAVIAFTDNTPEYAAGPASPGTAHIAIDPDDESTRSMVQRARDRALAADPDLLVASLHWGPNMVTEPPASFQAFGHWLIDEGIDVIHGHSAHVFQGIEIYRDRPILYDTGDFVDDYAVDTDLLNDRGFLFELGIAADGTPAGLTLTPTEISDCTVNAADGQSADWSCERIRELSAPFGTAFERTGDQLTVSLA